MPEETNDGNTQAFQRAIINSKDMTKTVVLAVIDYCNHHLTSQFLIVLVLARGWVVATTMVLNGDIKLDNTSAVAIYTAFSTGAVAAVGAFLNNKIQAKQSSASEEKKA